MKVAVIGGGMAGLGAAYEALCYGNEVVIFEKSSGLGGLAYTVDVAGEPLEAYYHHMFPNYDEFFAVAQELGIKHKIFFRRAKTGIFYGGKSYGFDTASDLLRFYPLSFFERIKAGLWVLFLRLKKNWRSFEPVTASSWMRRHFGERIYAVIWRPLLASKFGGYLEEVGMTWVWGRINERPSKFGYFEGGFKTLTDALEAHLKGSGAEIRTGTEVLSIERGAQFNIVTKEGGELFDRVIVAAPPLPFLKLAGALLPEEYKARVEKLKYVGTICGILILRNSFTPFYWLNVNDPGFPFLALIEHTNFVDPKVYGGNRILYLARYIDPADSFYGLPDEEIWREFLSALKRVNPAFEESWVKEKRLFRAPFTQPVVPTMYETELKPDYKTPIPGLLWVSMSHIYPWDRGTDRSFRTGREAAALFHDA